MLEALTDIVYPPHCIVCERSLHDQEDPNLCSQCMAELPLVGDTSCRKCGHELATHATIRARCRACQGKSLFFKVASAPFKYETSARDLILRLKLARQTSLAPPLAEHLISHIESLDIIPAIDVIIPVPLHWRRYCRRGYNQAMLLARPISRHFAVPLLRRCLRRKAATRSQTSFNMEERMENLRGAFAVRKNGMLKGKSVLLIDDVLTTGATCNECSRILMQDGSADAVYVVTVARTML